MKEAFLTSRIDQEEDVGMPNTTCSVAGLITGLNVSP